MILQRLEEIGVDMAFDDFGVGQARLVELVDIHPSYVKFDMSLIRGIHFATDERRSLVESLAKMTHDINAIPLAEGIECEEERNTCIELGFQLGQGFYFGRPTPLRRIPDDRSSWI